MKQQLKLRQRLRGSLRAEHEGLDELISGFDLGQRSGLVPFLRMQEAAMAKLPSVPGSAAALADLLGRARTDLTALGVRRMELLFEPLSELHPLSVDYVLGGSCLGTKILKTRWQSSKSPDIHKAAAYMSAPPYLEIWRGFCKIAQSQPGDGPMADRIVRDAAAIFELYAKSARQAYQEEAVQNV